METLFQFIEWALVFVLIAVGYIFGRIAELRHYKSIRAREKKLAHILIFNLRWPPVIGKQCDSALVTGSVVVSADYFKSFVGGLRKIIGGRFRGYETLVDRARREAVLRMKEDARKRGAKMIFNVRFETFQVGAGTRRGLAAVEVLAYGTALTI